jgi:drug/metabolite transporter (DMT)-like permease
MTRSRAVATMLLVTLLWSTAGVVSRWLEQAEAFEITFWRSAFNALALLPMLLVLRGPRALSASLRQGGAALWISGLCWSVMFTAFMVALSFTSVANVLVTMALGPLFTAVLARLLLGHRLAPRTWAAIALAGVGIAWLHGQAQQGQASPDMLPAVLLGAVISALVTLPLAWPLQASAHDIGWLALLGVVQLAIPCLLAVTAARWLSGPEIALLALLEVVFGVAWAWLGAGEAPTVATLGGGLLVLLALAGNEALALRRVGAPARA